MSIDPDRLNSELNRMKKLIAEDPKVLAFFDKDGNGVIDGDEWEGVRQLVIKRLKRADFEAALAQEHLSSLDEEQAAELARMEEDMQEEASPEPTLLRREPPKSRDFSGLELAFDPREDRINQQQSVADELYEREISRRYASSADSGRNLHMNENGSLADRRELVLEQQGGVKQLFGKIFRREYIVRAPDGAELGRIWQKQNEAFQTMGMTSFFEYPDLHFTVEDYASGDEYTLTRSTSWGNNSLAVQNPRNRFFVDTHWTMSFLRRKYEVRVTKEGMSYYVRRRALRPWTFDVLDAFDEPIGVMQRGWSGLGFLSLGNNFHIELFKEISPELMWGFLATALLADLDSEDGSRQSGLDFFNS